MSRDRPPLRSRYSEQNAWADGCDLCGVCGCAHLDLHPKQRRLPGTLTSRSPHKPRGRSTSLPPAGAVPRASCVHTAHMCMSDVTDTQVAHGATPLRAFTPTMSRLARRGHEATERPRHHRTARGTTHGAYAARLKRGASSAARRPPCGRSRDAASPASTVTTTHRATASTRQVAIAARGRAPPLAAH